MTPTQETNKNLIIQIFENVLQKITSSRTKMRRAIQTSNETTLKLLQIVNYRYVNKLNALNLTRTDTLTSSYSTLYFRSTTIFQLKIVFFLLYDMARNFLTFIAPYGETKIQWFHKSLCRPGLQKLPPRTSQFFFFYNSNESMTIYALAINEEKAHFEIKDA